MGRFVADVILLNSLSNASWRQISRRAILHSTGVRGRGVSHNSATSCSHSSVKLYNDLSYTSTHINRTGAQNSAVKVNQGPGCRLSSSQFLCVDPQDAQCWFWLSVGLSFLVGGRSMLRNFPGKMCEIYRAYQVITSVLQNYNQCQH